MSVSSNSRKESTESNAAQAMHSPMGLHPEQGLAQLNDKGLENELPSRVADSSDVDVPEDMTQTKANVAVADDEQGITRENIEESKRASWGKPSLSDDSVETDADWNSNTRVESIPATRANEPDRTLGNS